MLKFTDTASIAEALHDPRLDTDLRAVIRCLAFDLSGGGAFRVLVVEAGDTPAVINNAVGRLITGDEAEDLSFEWIRDHDGRWFEVALTPIDDLTTRVLVQNHVGVEMGVHALCLSHFWPHEDEGDQ